MQRPVGAGHLMVRDVDMVDAVEHLRQVKRAVDAQNLGFDPDEQSQREASTKLVDGCDELWNPVRADPDMVDERQLVQSKCDRTHDVLANRGLPIRKRGVDVHVVGGKRTHHAVHSIGLPEVRAASANASAGTTTS